MSTAARVMAALTTVRDPELDEPVTTLGFVASATISHDAVATIHLRLPTYFCAPNFAYLMVADAYDAVSRVVGIAQAVVILDDHFAADTINAGVASRSGFVGSFAGSEAGEAIHELDELRTTFLRKAVLAGTDQVCRALLREGRGDEDLVGLVLGDLDPTPALDRLRARRSELGLPADDDAPLVVDVVTGEALALDALPLHLRRARLTAVGIEANAGICRGMLSQRYAHAPAPVMVAGRGRDDR